MSEESLWLSLIKQSQNRGSSDEALLILLGDLESSKRSLIGYLCGSTNAAHNQDENFLNLIENLSYDYFEIDDPTTELSLKVNIWSIDQRLFPKMFDLVKIKGHDQRVRLFVVTYLFIFDSFLFFSSFFLFRFYSFFLWTSAKAKILFFHLKNG
jgi:hypothetical protein